VCVCVCVSVFLCVYYCCVLPSQNSDRRLSLCTNLIHQKGPVGPHKGPTCHGRGGEGGADTRGRVGAGGYKQGVFITDIKYELYEDRNAQGDKHYINALFYLLASKVKNGSGTCQLS